VEDLRKSLNQYLFYEFAMDLDEDESKVSDTWRRLAWAVGWWIRKSGTRT
jgi:hypothetical protein